MPPRRWLAYVTPAGLPVRRGHSAYGLAAVCFSVIAILTLVSIVRGWLPLSLLPLAVPAAGFACAGSLVACFAGAADTTAKQLFTWIGAAKIGRAHV